MRKGFYGYEQEGNPGVGRSSWGHIENASVWQQKLLFPLAAPPKCVQRSLHLLHLCFSVVIVSDVDNSGPLEI
jgi:hypothetical protein